MSWPGESLLIKLWETLAEKGIGGLLRPWQIRREAIATAEGRAAKMLILAEAERQAADIRSGRMRLTRDNLREAIPYLTSNTDAPRIEPDLGQIDSVDVATATIVSDAIRREVNVAKAITYAEAQLQDSTDKATDESINEDWIYRWRDYAGSVTSEELQSLWGKLLAGELKAPGSFSYRTLELVRNLSVHEANDIARLLRFVVDSRVHRAPKELLIAEGIDFGFLMKMQDIGVISGVEAIGMSVTLDSLHQERFIRPLCSHGIAVVVQHEDPTKTLKLAIYPLTAVGVELQRLGTFDPHLPYLRDIGNRLKGDGFTVALQRYKDHPGGVIELLNEIPFDPVAS